MEEQRTPAKGRKLGSSRRKQLRGMSSGSKTYSIPEEELFTPEIMEKVQDFFRECDKDQKGFITRADMQKLKKEDFPCSAEELELIFDGLDTDRNGYLTTEEFTMGLKQFLSWQTTTKQHRRRKAASRRVYMFPTDQPPEEADSEERKCFQAFMDQLGAENIFEDQSEIWSLWVKLRQDEPHLLGNLEEFLAKMTTRIKEARREKETLELTLKKRVIDHNQEVQQLYEEMEQQINRERQQLQHESKARSHLHTEEVQQALDIMDREVQRLLLVQSELEIQFQSLSAKQHAASTENQRLKQNKQDLENQLQQIHVQLQETQGQLGAMKERVSQPHNEEGSDRPLAEVTHEIPSPSQETLNKEETSGSEMQRRLVSDQEDNTPDSFHQPALYGIPVATEAASGLRTRVISIEEDPFPEFLKEGELYVQAQQEISDHSSLVRELDDAIAALIKRPEPQIMEADNLGLQGASSLHTVKQGGDPEQRIEPVKDLQNQVLSRNGDKPKGLPEELSVLSTDQPTSQEGTLKQGPTQAECHGQEGKQGGASGFESEMLYVAQKLKQRETVDGDVQTPAVSVLAMQTTIHKQKPPEGGVLHPDVQQLGVSEQARPDEIQKLLSMKDVFLADGRPPGASDQALLNEMLPEMKTSAAKTFERREPPKQETLPTYFPHVGAQHKEGPENEQAEEAHFRASQDTPQAKTQPQSTEEPDVKWVEETKGDMGIFQQEEKQESSMKPNADVTSKQGDHEYLANVIADQPGSVGKGTMETCSDPDHLYNVLFVGDSNVGKTSFLFRLHEDSFNPNLTATVGMDYRVKNLFVDNKCFALRLWDTAGQERYHSLTKQFFRKADGVVVMYDVTSEYSFADVRYWLSCIQESAGDGVFVLLLGNKTDCATERRVSTEEGERLAKEHELLFYECSAATGDKVMESMISLARSLKNHEDRLKTEVVEVPEPPKKKRGCCR